MADMFKYPVFFECSGLQPERIKKIETYFQIKRQSGGGDCGHLNRVSDNIYSVAFKDQKHQQAVLQKSQHDVDGLVFTVRDSLEPRTNAPITTSPESQDFTTPMQPTLALPPPPPDEEYKQMFDPYIFQFLKDCPKAEKKLEELLESFSCYVELHLEDGRLLVQRSAQHGSKDEARNWKDELDQFFGGYCFKEMDPQKIEALYESCQTRDEVNVYRSVDRAVVVGKHSQVEASLKEVEERLRLIGKTTSHQADDEMLVDIGETDKSGNDSQNLSKGTRDVVSNSHHGGLQVRKDEITGQRSVTMVNNSHGDLETTCPENLNGKKLLHGAGAVDGRENATDRAFQMDGTRGATAAPEDNVPVKIIHGTLETQKVDALVSPMVGHDPCSTRVGISLSKIVEPQLKGRFRKKTGKAATPGDAVIVDGFSGLKFNAIFFLNLIPWYGDQDGGAAAEVLRLGISKILNACEKRGFTSVAFPVLGAGAALNFPSSVVAKILLEEVEKFKQHRGCGTPLQVKIVIHPKDKESSENFKSELKAFQRARRHEMFLN